jgi:hypothetical protein
MSNILSNLHAMDGAGIAGRPGEVTVLEARNAHEDGMLRYRVAPANLQKITGAL